MTIFFGKMCRNSYINTKIAEYTARNTLQLRWETILLMYFLLRYEMFHTCDKIWVDATKLLFALIKLVITTANMYVSSLFSV